MKKLVALVLCLVLTAGLGITAFAAGTDDGTLSVAEKDGKKYFGSAVSADVTKYEAADGSGEIFYDLTDDRTMNVCDLVALTNGQVDFDLSGAFDTADTAALRLMLIGGNNR